MDWDDDVLQLFVVQHDIACPNVDTQPNLAAVHVVPDSTHEYVFVAVPADQTKEVF
jgi:hypothetical protein